MVRQSHTRLADLFIYENLLKININKQELIQKSSLV